MKPKRTDAEMTDSEFHYRYRTGAPPRWRSLFYRFGFRQIFPRILLPEYGGCRLPARHARAYYLGAGAGDWQRMASWLDETYVSGAEQMRSDFTIRHRRLRKIHIVVIAQPPGLAKVARKLGLQAVYNIPDDMEAQYFWYEPAVLITQVPSYHSFQGNCVHFLCIALCHQYFGATWPHTWAIHGYASFLTLRLMYPAYSFHPETLAHLERVARTHKLLRLCDLFAVDHPLEEHGGEKGYNELAHYVIHYLHSKRHEVPQAWEVVRAHMAREITSASEVVRRLEEAFKVPIDEIERRFFDWCAHMRSLMGDVTGE